MLYDGYDDVEHVCTFKIFTTYLGVTQNQSFISLMSHKNTLIVIWCMCCYHAVTILDTNLGVTQFLVICLKYHGKHVRCSIKYMFLMQLRYWLLAVDTCVLIWCLNKCRCTRKANEFIFYLSWKLIEIWNLFMELCKKLCFIHWLCGNFDINWS